MNSRPSFVRLDVLEFFRWVDDHKGDLSTAVSNLAKALMLGKAEEGTFARKLLDEANEFKAKKSEAGKKGMEARWGGNSSNPTRPPPRQPTRIRPISVGRCPSDREEFKSFVAESNLHPGLSEEWFAIHEGRGWVDESGEPIKNWKGAVTNYCNKKERRLNDAI